MDRDESGIRVSSCRVIKRAVHSQPEASATRRTVGAGGFADGDYHTYRQDHSLDPYRRLWSLSSASLTSRRVQLTLSRRPQPWNLNSSSEGRWVEVVNREELWEEMEEVEPARHWSGLRMTS